MRSSCMMVLDEIKGLNPDEASRLRKVVGQYSFLSNEYYLDLIDWDDPMDPIRRIIIFFLSEIRFGGTCDPSHEKSFIVVRGLEHKYGPIALLLVSRDCWGICHFCFRKRLFQEGNIDAVPDLEDAYRYIENHKEINNVLLSGGDPLFLKTSHLNKIVQRLLDMDHVRLIRIVTKIPAYDPQRIMDDVELKEKIQSIIYRERMC